MAIVFRSPAHGDVMMTDSHASRMLKLMGHSGGVPGALAADDIARSLEQLRRELAADAEREAAARREREANAAASEKQQDTPDSEQASSHVSLELRAQPLVTLLQAAQRAGEHVSWARS